MKTTADIQQLYRTAGRWLKTSGPDGDVVISTRVRVARNIAGHPFPNRAKPDERLAVRDRIEQILRGMRGHRDDLHVRLGENEAPLKQFLRERHLISRELVEGEGDGRAVVFTRGEAISVMINEEDHLRIQVLRAGFQLKKAWSAVDELDSALEDQLDYAFSPNLGYMTACPTNLGTAMRASAMMHLPALVIASQMEKVVRAVNQLGMVVRGLFGEGSDASGSIFQISNQTTLGESEEEIIKRLGSVLSSIIEHELNAREKLIEADAGKLFDKIGRAYGILQNSHVLSSTEAMNLLSLIRLGIDLELLPESCRPAVDRLFIEAQPGHLQHAAKREFEPGQRDLIRAIRLRAEFAAFPRPDYSSRAAAGPN